MRRLKITNALYKRKNTQPTNAFAFGSEIVCLVFYHVFIDESVNRRIGESIIFNSTFYLNT